MLEDFRGASELSGKSSMMRRETRTNRSAKLLNIHNSEIAGSSIAPDKFLKVSHPLNGKVLCQGQGVRVILRNGNLRVMQFKSDRGEWQMDEGKIRCQEDAALCEKREESPDVAACPSCTCTPWHPMESVWAHYQDTMLAKVQSQCLESKEYNLIIVGLGSSSALQAVAQHCKLGKVVVVEKQQEVVDAATKFFGFNTSSIGTSVQVLAPYEGVEGLKALVPRYGKHSYDAVLVDCMIQGKIPEGCKSIEFYKAIAQNLKPSGLVLQWTWAPDQKDVLDKLSQGLEAPVQISHSWASGHETDTPSSLVMLSSTAQASLRH